ncbi:hypothetical protein SEVIR_2G384950v4 [Setaria viridis]
MACSAESTVKSLFLFFYLFTVNKTSVTKKKDPLKNWSRRHLLLHLHAPGHSSRWGIIFLYRAVLSWWTVARITRQAGWNKHRCKSIVHAAFGEREHLDRDGKGAGCSLSREGKRPQHSVLRVRPEQRGDVYCADAASASRTEGWREGKGTAHLTVRIPDGARAWPESHGRGVGPAVASTPNGTQDTFGGACTPGHC